MPRPGLRGLIPSSPNRIASHGLTGESGRNVGISASTPRALFDSSAPPAADARLSVAYKTETCPAD